MNSLNFKNRKKQYFNVVLPDDTKLSVMLPTKAMMENLWDLQKEMKTDPSAVSIDDMYEMCARFLSRNKEEIEITTEQLTELLEFEDIVTFIREFSQFMNNIFSAKN